MCRLAFDAAVPRPSCLPPLPLAGAPGSGGPASSQRARQRGDGHRPGAFEARRLHVGRLRRRQREVRCECTRTARATTRRRPAERRPMARQDARQRAASRRPSWAGFQPDWMRDPDHGGCADRPKYRLSNDAGLVHSRGTVRRIRGGGIAARRAAQRSAGTAAEGTPSMRRRGQCCTTPAARRRPRASSGTRAGRPRCAASAAASGGSVVRTMLPTDKGRGSEPVPWPCGSTRYQPTATLSDGL